MENKIVHRKVIPQIESLRAIAVLTVFVNHINSAWLPGGYLGVDIFFVISGYVITRSLLNQNPQSFWDFLAKFYVARIKRILPLLSVVAISAIFLIRMFNPDPKITSFTGISAMVGGSNIFLYLISSDYFGENIKLNPLMHTWSLGVEEQFYFIFPLLFIAVIYNKLRGTNFLLISLGLLSCISILLFYMFIINNPSIAYYLLPFRFWELGVGCILAILNPQVSSTKIYKLIQIVSLAMILSCFIIGGEAPFLSTVLAVLGSAGLIMCVGLHGRINKALENKLMQFIGKISYSLYLWHWVMICLFVWTFGISINTIPIIVALTFILSILSYYFVENPARAATWFKLRRANIFAGISIMCVSILIILAMYRLNLPDFAGDRTGVIAYAGYEPDSDLQLPTGRKISDCMGRGIGNDEKNALVALEKCSAEVRGAPVFIFFGDSHSLDMFGIAEQIVQNKVGTVINFGQPGCRAPQQEGAPDYCNYTKTIINSLPPQTNDVFVVVRSNYFPRAIDGSLDSYKPKIVEFYEFITSKGFSLIWIANSPEFPSLEDGGLCTEQWYRPAWAISEKCSVGATVSYMEEAGRRSDIFNLISNMAEQQDNFYIFDPFKVFCDVDKGVCSAKRGERVLYRDASHITTFGAEVFSEQFIEFLDKKINI